MNYKFYSKYSPSSEVYPISVFKSNILINELNLNEYYYLKNYQKSNLFDLQKNNAKYYLAKAFLIRNPNDSYLFNYVVVNVENGRIIYFHPLTEIYINKVETLKKEDKYEKN